ncbi:MAG: DUF4091 domain-containing protein [Kiritimatiellae bacterium]|nr:DUF4091 domain-containing protein [Kiritimatiellia bacterium]
MKEKIFALSMAASFCLAAVAASDLKWEPSKPGVCSLMPGKGRNGGAAMAICGKAGERINGSWRVKRYEYRPDAFYGMAYWVNRERTGSELVFENPFHWVINSAHITSGWEELKTVFKTPPSPTNTVGGAAIREYKSQGLTLIDSPRLVELVPEWRKEQGLELGHGEFVCGNLYSFTTQLKASACAAARPFVWARNGARSGFKLDIPSGGEVLYRFALPNRRFKDAEGTIASVYRKGGRLMVEASADGGAEWTALACITDATPYKISFPAKLFPSAEMLLRLRMEGAPKERIHIGMLGFSGHFEGRPARMAGRTRFVEKATGAVFLEAGSLDYRVDTFGERLPAAEGIQLWRASSGRKVMRDAEVPSATAGEVVVKTAANEAEAVQLVITPERDLQDVRLEVEGPLIAKRRGVFKKGGIDVSAVEILREHYLDITITTDQLGTRDAWPDALPPQDEGLWPAKGGESTPFWIKVKPPKGTPKGVYLGMLLVKYIETGAAKAKVLSVPFEVEVFGFELPDEMTIKTPFGINYNTIYHYHRATNASDKAAVKERYLKFLGDNHISPYPIGNAQPVLKWKNLKDPQNVSLTIDWEKFDRETEDAIAKYHFNAIKVPLQGLGGGNQNIRHKAQIAGVERGSLLYEKMMKMYLREVERHFEEKGWIDKAFVYWFDEPLGQDYAYVNAGMDTLKKYAPKLRRMITNRCTADLMDTINTWCPVPHHLHVPELDECRRRGDEMWWYICSSPPATLPGCQIDHPGTDLRVWLWQSWDEDISGILIWTVVWWSGRAGYPDMNNQQDPYLDPVGWGKRYNPGVKVSVWGNGDGRFCYPPLSARNGRQKETVIADPVSCIRMEMLRDGIEDYEYFAMLKRLDAKNSLLVVPKNVYRALDDYSANPAYMETHREKLAGEIERLIEGRNK